MGCNAYNFVVKQHAFKMALSNWNGPLAYVGSAGIAGILNTVSAGMVKEKLAVDTATNLESILLALTGVSMFVIALQFIYARAIGEGNRAPVSQGFLLSIVAAATVIAACYWLIDSTLIFKFEIAFWLGLATFLSLIACARLATLLINQEWGAICFLVLLGAGIRLILWNISWFRWNIEHLVIAVVICNLIPVLYLYLSRHEYKYVQVNSISFKEQLIPMGILLGLVSVIGLGSISRRATLGNLTNQYFDIALRGRGIFFMVLIVAYASFPKICKLPLFSRDLGKHFRQAQFIAVAISGSGTCLVLLQNLFLADLDNHRSQHQQLALIVGLIGWSTVSLSVIPILYFLAHNSRLGLAVYAPVLVLVQFQLFATTPLSLSIGFLISAIILLMIVTIPAFLRSKPRVRAEISQRTVTQLPGTDSLTVVIPSYNSGFDGVKTVLAVYNVLQYEVASLQVVVVSDGSTDNSVALLDELSHPWFKHVKMENRGGKGAALREGFAHARTDITAFIDADGDIPPRLLLPMYQTFNYENADVVFGSKWHPKSELDVTVVRRIVSRIHHVIQIMLFKLDIDDTQVGIKMYRNQYLQEVLPILREEGFSLDLELFIAFAAHGHKKFVEMPVEIVRTGSSTISVGNIATALWDMFRIFWRARISLQYDALAYISANEPKRVEV